MQSAAVVTSRLENFTHLFCRLWDLPTHTCSRKASASESILRAWCLQVAAGPPRVSVEELKGGRVLLTCEAETAGQGPLASRAVFLSTCQGNTRPPILV